MNIVEKLISKRFNNMHIDECYTPFPVVDERLRYYADSFKGKSIYNNCDYPLISNYFKWFIINFNELNLKSVLATNAETPYVLATKALVTKVPQDVIHGTYIDFDSLFGVSGNYITTLEGNGDFRSDECLELLRASDVVVSNPPLERYSEWLECAIDTNTLFLWDGRLFDPRALNLQLACV